MLVHTSTVYKSGFGIGKIQCKYMDALSVIMLDECFVLDLKGRTKNLFVVSHMELDTCIVLSCSQSKIVPLTSFDVSIKSCICCQNLIIKISVDTL